MYYSIRGKIVAIESKLLVIETGGIGYEVYVSKPSMFSVGEEVFLYTHHHIKEDCEYLAGFKNKEEQEAFNLLIHVSGIGPKGALNILGNTNYEDLFKAVSDNNLDFIESISGVTPKIASQIILDLKGYLSKYNMNNTVYVEVRNALKRLKFKTKEIDGVLPYIYKSNSNKEDIMKEALRRLNYGNQRPNLFE